MSEYIVCPHCHNPLGQSEYVRVIRCRDCRWLLEDERYSEAACRFFCRTLPRVGYQDGFCAWAERKEVGE